MEQKQHSQKFLKQRKFMVVLPLLILPFVFVFFMAMGGGKGTGVQSHQFATYQGINLKLPDAHFKKGKEKDKLGFYDQAQKDSFKIREAIKNDPYYKKDTVEAIKSIFERSAAKFNQPTTLRGFSDPNEEKVMEKLAILKNELNKKTVTSPESYTENPDIAKLEKMMRNISTKSEEDPQIKQLGGMLDKIMLIQHPEKLLDSMARMSEKNRLEAYSVSTGTTDTADQNAFFGLNDEVISQQANTIQAVIEETQTLVSGAVVKLRLIQDIYVHGSLISKDQLIYGLSSLNNERLKIAIKSIRSNSTILPVALNVYDMDGLEGIYVPGSISRDVGKESAGSAISSLGIESLDPSLGAQAANAGIQAAKTLMSKKIKLVQVTVKAGYQVLLKDETKKTN